MGAIGVNPNRWRFLDSPNCDEQMMFYIYVDELFSCMLVYTLYVCFMHLSSFYNNYITSIFH